MRSGISAKQSREGSGEDKKRSPKNKTLTLSKNEIKTFRKRLLSLNEIKNASLPTGTFNGDYRLLLKNLPAGIVSLLILDPPYNLTKEFKSSRFSRRSVLEYEDWLDEMLSLLKPCLKPDATIYICGDWYSSVSIHAAAARHFQVRNRICWEREKGRGASANWKNSSEDIWFCTVSDTYTFNVDQVKLRRKVIAPYRNEKGAPKDWSDTAAGAYRDTYPSNIWTDISVPFWSMPENTEHPTQKSEKLLAKLILASSKPGDLVFDPFLGSGSTSVTAKKLGRNFLGCEIDETYCLLAEKRLAQLRNGHPYSGICRFCFLGTQYSRRAATEAGEPPALPGLKKVWERRLAACFGSQFEIRRIPILAWERRLPAGIDFSSLRAVSKILDPKLAEYVPAGSRRSQARTIVFSR